MGNPAMIPLWPKPKTDPLLPVAVLTLAAFFCAVVAVLLANSMGVRPFLPRRAA